MGSPSKQARLHLALEVIQNNKKLSIRAAAKFYNVPEATLRHRRAGRPV
jgi:DeoR/GlpR family transcriptional regulator of sugar metabolism